MYAHQQVYITIYALNMSVIFMQAKACTLRKWAYGDKKAIIDLQVIKISCNSILLCYKRKVMY